MRTMLFAAAGALCVLTAPASASPCTDQINALEARLNDLAEAAIATSSGGQAVAAAREGKAVATEDGSKQPAGPTPPFQKPERAEEAVRKTIEAGDGGDKVVQAKATLNEAKNLDQKGDTSGCLAKVADAKRQAGIAQ